MYPLLSRRGYFAVYLLLWLLMGALLAALLAGQGGLASTFALAVALPLMLAFSFVCLSSWYVARSMPLAGTGMVRVTATAIAAAMLSSAFWVAMARGWMWLIGPPFGGDPRPGVDPLLFGFGVLLYLLSLAISYVLAVFAASQEARRRELQVQVLAREAELRSLRA